MRCYGITCSGKIEIVFGEARKPLPFRIPELVTIAQAAPPEPTLLCIAVFTPHRSGAFGVTGTDYDVQLSETR